MKKTYTIELDEKDKVITLTRRNDGFNVLELIGILELSILEIRDQLQGDIKPDVIKRQFIEPNEPRKFAIHKYEGIMRPENIRWHMSNSQDTFEYTEVLKDARFITDENHAVLIAETLTELTGEKHWVHQYDKIPTQE